MLLPLCFRNPSDDSDCYGCDGDDGDDLKDMIKACVASAVFSQPI